MSIQKQQDANTVQVMKEVNKQIEELNNKVTGQEETITQLNNNIATLSNAVSDTKQAVTNTQHDLTSAKATQKADKAEVVNHADEGDSNLQQQIDTINSNYGENREVPKPSVGGDIG